MLTTLIFSLFDKETLFFVWTDTDGLSLSQKKTLTTYDFAWKLTKIYIETA